MKEKEYRYIVSACLAGIFCRWDGKCEKDDQVSSWVEQEMAIPVCPEELGGLKTPRSRMGIESGDGEDVLLGRSRVLSEEGKDVTQCMIKGAYQTLKIAKNHHIGKAIFKQKSPSCGCGLIWRNKELITGDGITTALLKKEGIRVIPR